ncbi:MAG TPA: AraC family transcriptional regulator [Thermoleophilaceae bacterium]|nr:AraC family transcriptional regulator [Thermoleophilaceae bacterium]
MSVNAAPLARHLLRARDLMDSRFAEPLDLEALASVAGVSPRHFSRSFRRTFGETPHQYLLTRRIERARYLLRTTDLRVAEVCLDVGWGSVGSFTTSFRRHVGVSPTEYRRENGGPRESERIPLCFIKAWSRLPVNGAFREDSVRTGD